MKVLKAQSYAIPVPNSPRQQKIFLTYVRAHISHQSLQTLSATDMLM